MRLSTVCWSCHRRLPVEPGDQNGVCYVAHAGQDGRLCESNGELRIKRDELPAGEILADLLTDKPRYWAEEFL